MQAITFDPKAYLTWFFLFQSDPKTLFSDGGWRGW